MDSHNQKQAKILKDLLEQERRTEAMLKNKISQARNDLDAKLLELRMEKQSIERMGQELLEIEREQQELENQMDNDLEEE